LDDLWNLPIKLLDISKSEDLYPNHIYEKPGRYQTMRSIVAKHFGTRPIKILEIGVFRAGLIKAMYNSELKITTYEGVDPYMGNESDPYTGAYWNDSNESNGVYLSSKAIFDKYSQPLHRKTSTEFHKTLPGHDKYDLIVVDGDHTYRQALWDMATWFYRIEKGGMMIVDDYANSDTPQVTKAVTDFIRLHRPNIKRMGYRSIEFLNRGKEIPTALTFVYFEPKDEIKRIEFVSEALSKNISLRLLRRVFKVLKPFLEKLP